MSKYKRKQVRIRVYECAPNFGWDVQVIWPIKAGGRFLANHVYRYERKSSAMALANKLEAEFNDVIVEVEEGTIDAA